MGLFRNLLLVYCGFYAEDSPPVETMDTVEGAMAKIKVAWANIIANRDNPPVPLPEK
jgi:hypothetical protein